MDDADADFLSLLQEIERADALDTTARDSKDLLDLLLLDEETPATPTGDATAIVASHAERCRLNRKRKKQELEELRAAAASLESALANIVQPQTKAPWQEASRLAQLQYHRAVTENKKLREMVEQHWVAAQHIQQAIRAVPNAELLHSLRLEPSSVRTLKRPRDESPAPLSRGVYNELFQSIHSTYEQDDISDEIARLKIGTRKISMDMVSEAHGTEMSIRVLECRALPFSLSYVRDATWRHLSTPSLPANETCGPSPLTRFGDDMFGECGADCNPLPTTASLPPGRLAIRRYVEPNRLTFVWECDGCYQCDDAKNPIGRVTERGWCTIEPSAKNSASSTVFRIQVQYVPHTTDSSAQGCCPSSRTKLSSDIALALYRRTIARTFGAVEREVFQDDATKCKGKPCG